MVQSSIGVYLLMRFLFQRVVIDCRGHLLGRLASVLAKELLNGQRIVAVRCEEINISGSHFRNKRESLAVQPGVLDVMRRDRVSRQMIL